MVADLVCFLKSILKPLVPLETTAIFPSLCRVLRQSWLYSQNCFELSKDNDNGIKEVIQICFLLFWFSYHLCLKRYWNKRNQFGFQNPKFDLKTEFFKSSSSPTSLGGGWDGT